MSGAAWEGDNGKVYLIFVIISLLLYSRAFDNGFRQDDYIYLKHVETTSLLDSLRPSGEFSFYRPGAIALFRIERGLFGRAGGAYIAFNCMLHLATSALMLLVLRRIRPFPGAEAVAAGLFLLGIGHYGKVVMWACCSGQITSIALSLAGILFSMRWAGCGEEDQACGVGRGRGGSLALALAVMSAAVLFHEGAIVTPAVAALAVLACPRSGLYGRPRAAAILLLPLPLYAAFYGMLSVFHPTYGLGEVSILQVPVYLLRFAGFAVLSIQRTGIVEIPRALQKLIGIAPLLHLAAGAVLTAVLVYLAVFRGSYARILSVWFVAAILPFTLVDLPGDWLQLRYLYHASIPLCALAAIGFNRLASGRRAIFRAAASVMLLAAVLYTSTLVLLLERHYAGF